MVWWWCEVSVGVCGVLVLVLFVLVLCVFGVWGWVFEWFLVVVNIEYVDLQINLMVWSVLESGCFGDSLFKEGVYGLVGVLWVFGGDFEGCVFDMCFFVFEFGG